MNLYGLIGYPLGHSFSKQYFTEKFNREGLKDCSFQAFPIDDINQLPALLKQNNNLKGLSVTIPYKEQVLKFVTVLSDEVKSIGATNSIKISNKVLTAFNTDIIGFKGSFYPLLQPHHTKALVLGTGGASKAVQYVLKKLGIAFLIVTRNENRQAYEINYDRIDQQLMNEYLIIINATPVGMSPHEDACPGIPYQFITPQHYLYDLVYKPEKTLFLQFGEEKTAIIKNGHEMLILQAEASWKLWNND